MAKDLGVTIVQIYLWISTRKMPAHLVGGVWMFNKEDVLRWYEESGVKKEPAQKAP